MKNITNSNSKKNQQNKERLSVDDISLQNNKPFSDKIVFAIMGIVFLLIYVYIFDKKADLNGDNFAYYALGKSIHDFRGFSSIWAPVASPHNHFPPGYPFILSIGMFISSNPIFLTSINGFLLFLSVFLLYKFLNNIGTDQRLSLVISVLLFLNATLLKSSTIMMSEVCYLFGTSLVLFFVTKLKPNTPVLKDYYLFFLILALGFSFYVRSQGLSLFAGVLFFLLLSKQWVRFGVTLGGTAALIYPWFWRGKQFGGNAYAEQLLSKNPYQPELGKANVSDLVERFLHNVQRYVTIEIPNGTIGTKVEYFKESYTSGEWFFGISLIILIFFGFWMIKRAYKPLMFGVIGGTFGIILLWPEQWYGSRFLFNMIPILFLLAAIGLYKLLELLMKKVSLSFFTTPFILLAFIIPFSDSLKELHDYAQEPYPAPYSNMFDVAEWASTNTPESSVFCCRKPEMFFYFSNRPCVNYLNGVEKEVIKGLEDSKVKYVVLEQLGYGSTYKYLLPAIQNNPNRFKLLYQVPNPDTYLFEFH